MTEHNAKVQRDIQKMIAVETSPEGWQRRRISDAFCIVAQQEIADSMNG